MWAARGCCLEYATPGRYLGIDPSLGMLARMRAVWPEARTVCTLLQSFVGGRYDVVLALFGMLNYLTAEEITLYVSHPDGTGLWPPWRLAGDS
jgi:hypothetical protein